MMNEYEVTLPITGLAFLTVQAESEKAAITQAIETVTVDNIEEWQAVEHILRGNVVYALQPWSATAEDLGPIE